MFKTTVIAAAITTVAVMGLTGCDVKKTQEGSVTMPKYEVEKTKEGNVTMPKYDVTAPDVKVTTTEKTIEVPKVEITTAKEKEAQGKK
jgi:uncharacterized lipoprotein